MHQKIHINTDGGSRGNPGKAAIGIVISDEKRNELECHKETIGNATNNIAEYKALIKALHLAVKYTKNEVHVFMDSELVVRQMSGLYRIREEHLLELHKEAKQREKSFSKVVYNHVRRSDKYQQKADELVNEALDGR